MTQPHTYDVAIIGAGPIGLELAACLKRAGVDYIQFDAQQIGYTLTWWPRNTSFFSTTERLAIAGVPIQNNHQQRITGEEYLAYLRGVVEQFDLRINSYEPVIAIERQGDSATENAEAHRVDSFSVASVRSVADPFVLTTRPLTGERRYVCRRVVLAVGDMHWPNRLGIPGEDLPHVAHYF